MVCLRNICVNTLHKEDGIFTNNNNNNNGEGTAKRLLDQKVKLTESFRNISQTPQSLMMKKDHICS
jgi:hypothetical protein